MKTIPKEPSSRLTRSIMSRPSKTPLTKIAFHTARHHLRCFVEPQLPSYRNTAPARPRARREQSDVKACDGSGVVFDEKSLLCSVLGQLFEQDISDIRKTVQNTKYSSSNRGCPDGNTGPTGEMEKLRQIFNCQDQPLMQGKQWEDPQGQLSSNSLTSQAATALNPEKQDSSSTYNSSEGNRDELTGQQAYIYYQNFTLYRQLQRKRRSLQDAPVSAFAIDCDAIERDGRTTLMIRHIPNKYTEQMLFHELSRKFKNRINFLYLPIDAYNECNMGYAFVNFVHTRYIRPFLEEFNGRRWSRFNSGKICELAYARIQGTNSLLSHFENARPAGSSCKLRNGPQPGRAAHHLATSA